jgi:hypothetical protein
MMGLRSLIEINHDGTSRISEDAAGFAQAITDYVRAGSSYYTSQLYTKYDARVVALRHSNDSYYIPGGSFGFPAKLPWDDFEKERDRALLKAKELTGGKRNSRASMEAMITELVQIVERQQEVLDDI